MKTETNLDHGCAESTTPLANLLKDAALQLSRLTGPNLETYARTFAALAGSEAMKADSLTSCRDHWKTSFDHERENVIRLRRALYEAHNSIDPAVKPCRCMDCNLVRTRGNGQPAA